MVVRARSGLPLSAIFRKALFNEAYAKKPCERNYFLAAAPVPGFPFKIEGDAAAGFGFSALDFFGSRLLLF
jgi:hypothetical protein